MKTLIFIFLLITLPLHASSDHFFIYEQDGRDVIAYGGDKLSPFTIVSHAISKSERDIYIMWWGECERYILYIPRAVINKHTSLRNIIFDKDTQFEIERRDKCPQ